MVLTIVGASGKLGFATLNALLDHNLIGPDKIVCTTSSNAGENKLAPARSKGVEIRHANWDDDAAVWESALMGTEKLFLISSSRIQKDFGDAEPGKGRESDHLKVLEAAKKVGVKHLYYTSLAFANPSKSRVMKAHERTEAWLKDSGMDFTVIREGLYNESWPLYFGHYDVGSDDRTEVPVAGDSKISWTSIPDLGLANAAVLSQPSQQWSGKTFYLAQEKAYTLSEVADMVAKAKGKGVNVKVVDMQEHERYYVQERGMQDGMVTWWSKTYNALRDEECEIHDPTLELLLKEKGVTPKPMEDTVSEMIQAQQGS